MIRRFIWGWKFARDITEYKTPFVIKFRAGYQYARFRHVGKLYLMRPELESVTREDFSLRI